MLRGISYRRDKLKYIVIKRLKSNTRHRYYMFKDANNISISQPHWFDYIGTETEFMYKTMTTDKCQTNYKEKYGKKTKNRYYTNDNRSTRLIDKKLFRKLLESEYGIKHIYT